MHDPLREHDQYRRRKARSKHVAGSILRRTSRLGDTRSDGPPSYGSTTDAAVVVHFHSRTHAPPLGHNGGPRLEPDDPNESWRHYCWRRAHKKAWQTLPREIALRRLARAETLGMTYREYTLEILERGRYL